MKYLTGDKNQCAGCSEYFNSSLAFEKHRTGEHKDNGRRCLTAAEMMAKGMALNAKGFWISEAYPTELLEKKRESNQIADSSGS